jgi:hypothetical protein
VKSKRAAPSRSPAPRASSTPWRAWEKGSSVAEGVEGAARKGSVCRRPESSGGAILTHGPQARNRSLVKGRIDGPKARLESRGGEFSTWPSEKSRRLNDLWSARFGSTGEASGSEVFGGQEARAASAAGEGSPRGPVVLVRQERFS